MSEHKDYGGECYSCGGTWPCDYERGYRDALTQAADDLIEAFPQTFRGEDGYLSARMYSSGEYAEWLRARAEQVNP